MSWQMASLLLLGGSTALLFAGMPVAIAGLIDPADSFYTTPRFAPLAYIVGGLTVGGVK